MRGIKFRAWDTMYGKWLSAFYLSEDGLIWIMNPLSKEMQTSITQRFKIMQYAGLHDKNGKEIYEGDILLHFDKRYVVKWDERMAAFQTENPHNTVDCDFFNWFIPSALLSTQESPSGSGHADCEVIGNIYENPKLISEVK